MLYFDGDPVRIGFWKSEGFARRRVTPATDLANLLMNSIGQAILEVGESDLPSVFDHVDPAWPHRERQIVVRYLLSDRHTRTSYLGDSTCRICGDQNGAADVSDGKYVWPDGLAHYLDLHNVRPPQDFIDHVLRKTR